MYKNKLGKVLPAAAMAVAIGCSSIAPVAAFAATTGGVRDTVKTQESHSGDTDFLEKVDASVETTVDAHGGKWTDAKGGSHDNGKFTVTIPTGIEYSNVDAGHFDQSGEYDVNVAGVIRTGDTVTATATHAGFVNAINDSSDTDLSGKPVGDASRNPGNLTATVTQGKSVWTADEVSTMQDAEDGSARVVGTTAKDAYRIKGDVRNSNTFNGEIAYSFTTSKPNQNQ